jgi:uncharacterized protein YukE
VSEFSRIHLLKQAAEKEELARHFESYAERLGETFSQIPTSPAESVGFWTGPAAERFARQAAQLKRDIEGLKSSCTTTAKNLRKSADQLRKYATRGTGIH